MSNIVTAPQGSISALAKQYMQQHQQELDELGAGITAGFAVVTYKGKVWRVKHRGEDHVLMAADKVNPRQSLEVVIIKGAANISKIFYESGYVEGSSAAPDCWSTNGITPDAGASKKQSNMCAGCPKNAWGSKVGDNGKPGKACQDSKRLAIVPADDLENEFFGGPMLLRIPPASLKELANYAGQMKQLQFPYFSIKTRLSFDFKEAYPKLMFNGITPLTDEETARVLALRSDPRVAKILSEAVENVQADVVDPQQAALAAAFEKPPATVGSAAPAPAPVVIPEVAAAVVAASHPQPAPAPAAAPAVVQTVAAVAPTVAAVAPSPATPEAPVEAPEGEAPPNFNQLLNDLL